MPLKDHLPPKKREYSCSSGREGPALSKEKILEKVRRRKPTSTNETQSYLGRTSRFQKGWLSSFPPTGRRKGKLQGVSQERRKIESDFCPSEWKAEFPLFFKEEDPPPEYTLRARARKKKQESAENLKPSLPPPPRPRKGLSIGRIWGEPPH